MIKFEDVNKVFKVKDKEIIALSDINLEVDKGDIFGVIGFSGAGKSTLLRVINNIEVPTSGQVTVDDKVIGKLSKEELRMIRKDIGMIFQHFNLLTSKSVFDNIAVPLKLNKISKKDVENKVNELLSFVGLEDKISSYPSELSGGEKQRVGIARALATNPKILLCDEATSALDPQTTQSILSLLKKINKEYNITIVLITHEMNVIREICNKVVVMEKGRILEQGSVIEVFGNPKEKTSKNFVRTVIRDRVPKGLIKFVNENSENSVIYRLKFLGENSKESAVSAINKKFDIETNILFATVTEIEDTILGNLILQIKGSKSEILKVDKYLLDRKIDVKEISIDELK